MNLRLMRLFWQPRRSIWQAALCLAGVALVGLVSLCRMQAQKPPVPVSHIDPKAQALLNQTINALGGATFLNFKTMKTVGRAFSIADGVTSGFVHYENDEEFPDKRRLSYGFGKKKVITLINNGDQGWEIDRYGLIEQSDKQLQAWKQSNRYGLANMLRRLIHETGTLIQSGGQDFVNNHPAAIVDIVDARQVDVKLYLDTETHLPLRITYRLPNPATQDWDDYTEVYTDYQEIQSVDTPMHLIRYVNDQRVAETFRFQARYGPTYPPGTFQPPG